MPSLRSRVLLSASLVLVIFLGCTGFLLDRAFRDSARNAVEDRLRGRIFMLIGAADFDATLPTEPVGDLPEPALAVPGSGQYARILDVTGHTLWSSTSMLGVTIAAPPRTVAGQWSMQRTKSDEQTRLFMLTYTIIWEGAGEQAPREFVLQAFEDDRQYRETVARFRRSLWFWFGGLSVALLFVQALNLSRGLRPLSAVGEEVRAIEEGRQDRISGAYPSELASLTGNLNKLLSHDRESLKRYRNSLGDLAHSIKTPLAILRNEIDRVDADGTERSAREQIERIDRTVHYYLERSAAAGRNALMPPLAVAVLVRRVVASLEKVHAARELEIEIVVSPDLMFAVDEGDLMEIVGNLADNACKWASRRVQIVVAAATGQVTGKDNKRPRLVIEVRDDGAGIAADKIDVLKQRGVRLDESVEGHGIGLAIVRDMVEEAYGGRFELSSDATGTLAHVELPPP